MIKINRDNKPLELTDEKQDSLTEIFKETKKRVWNQPYIKESLFNMTFGKCSYCECLINIEGNYMEVEHFYPKNIYPDLVVKWENLLPSCKRCNVNKRDHDPNVEEIIDPSVNNPKDHLYLNNYRYRSKDKIGETSIGVLCLNDSEKAVHPRFSIGECTEEIIESLERMVSNVNEKEIKTRQKNQIVNGCKNLFREGSSRKQYSALVASVIMSNNKILDIINKIKTLSLWDEELDLLLIEVKQCELKQ